MKDVIVCEVLGGSCIAGMLCISNSNNHNPIELKSTVIIKYLFCCFQVSMAFEESHFKEFKSHLSFISCDLVRIQICSQQQVMFSLWQFLMFQREFHFELETFAYHFRVSPMRLLQNITTIVTQRLLPTFLHLSRSCMTTGFLAPFLISHSEFSGLNEISYTESFISMPISISDASAGTDQQRFSQQHRFPFLSGSLGPPLDPLWGSFPAQKDFVK